VLGLAAATRITPFAVEGIAGATWGPADGVVDPHLATRAYLELAGAAGAQVRYGCQVTAIDPDTKRGGWGVTAGGGPALRAEYRRAEGPVAARHRDRRGGVLRVELAPPGAKIIGLDEFNTRVLDAITMRAH
jgi:hypothetical protein